MLALLLAASLAAPPADARVLLLDGMRQELDRSFKELKLPGHEPPYFMSYAMKEEQGFELAAKWGALFTDEPRHERHLYVDVRVGSYDFDNSIDEANDFNFSMKGASFVAPKVGPLDDDPAALRAALWLATDERYKAALSNYLKKRGEGVYGVEDKTRPPSFSRESPSKRVDPDASLRVDRAQWAARVKELSSRFNAVPDIFASEVRFDAGKLTRWFVSSEGSALITTRTLYGVHLAGVARAPDGQLLEDSRDLYAPSPEQLPAPDGLSQATQAVIDELVALRAAPAIDPYTGPAILEPDAAGVLFHEAIGHRLEGDRQDSDTEGKTFKGQVGNALLPAFLSIFDDPSLREAHGQPLNGAYAYDDEGVPGQRATLVRDGVLRGFLLSRHPVDGLSKSNGHGRGQGELKPVARMANLVVESKRQVSDAELKRMLIAEAKRQQKPYGLILRDIQGGDTNTSTFGYQAFKGKPRLVYRVDVRNGKETLVRGVEIVGTPLSSVNKILATGKEQGVFNGFCGAESGLVPVSTVAPALLLQEIELQRVVEGKDRPPLLKPPF